MIKSDSPNSEINIFAPGSSVLTTIAYVSLSCKYTGAKNLKLVAAEPLFDTLISEGSFVTLVSGIVREEGTPLFVTLKSTRIGLDPASSKYKSTEETNIPPLPDTTNVCATGSCPPPPPPFPPPPPSLLTAGGIV